MNSRQAPIYQRPNVGAGNHGGTAVAKPPAPAKPAPAPAAAKPIVKKEEDVLLHRWRTSRAQVTVAFTSGAELEGRIDWIERYSLSLVTPVGLVHVNKASVSWIRENNPAQ